MARRLEFSTYRSEATDEPIEMGLNDRDFYFKPSMAGITLLGFLESIDSPSNAIAAKGIRDLFGETLIEGPAEFPDSDPPISVPEDNVAAFWAYIEDKDNHVDLPKLQEIANGLVEEISGMRPTQSSQKSADGSATNGSGSTGKRSARGATSRRSRSTSSS